MSNSRPEATFLDLVGIAVPIVQAPMAGATTPQLAAAVSAAGGLGGLGLGTAGVGDARQQIRDAQALGAQHLNVNFFLHTVPRPSETHLADACAGAEQVARSFGVAAASGTTALWEPFGSEMLKMVLEERPSLAEGADLAS